MSGIYQILEWSPYKDSVKYTIYRGTTKDNLVKIGETTLLQFQDTGVSITKKFDRVTYYYQVRSVDKNGDEVPISEVSTIQQSISYPYQGLYNEIVRRNKLMLARMTGEQVTFYIRKGAGERCEKCFNEVTRASDQETDLCDFCYNTTFKGGYEAITGFCRIRNAPEFEKETIFGNVLTTLGKIGWTADYPIVSDGDKIKVKNGLIYVIDSPTRRKQKDFTTVQVFGLKTLETTNPLYRVLG